MIRRSSKGPPPLTKEEVEQLLQERIRPIEDAQKQLIDRLRPFGDRFWWEAANLWEPSVQIALTDLCKPGATVYDVGANFGGLSAVMSRLVGPRGIVCSFEASPRIFGLLQQNIIKQGFSNTFPYPRAVYSRSGEIVKIYPGDHLNDSIYSRGSGDPQSFSLVETVTLDDFSSLTGLVPTLIKMDIEGAEYDAVLGSAQIIESSKPHIILEQQTDDSRCLNALLEKGYVALDLNTYQSILTASDYPSAVGLRNVLFVHNSRLIELPYTVPTQREQVADLTRTSFHVTEHGFTTRPLRLSPARYFADMRFSAKGIGNEMVCGVKIDGEIAFQYHAYTKLLADSYRDWVFEVRRDADVEFFFTYRANSRDETFVLEGGEISKIRGFRPSAVNHLLLR